MTKIKSNQKKKAAKVKAINCKTAIFRCDWRTI